MGTTRVLIILSLFLLVPFSLSLPRKGRRAKRYVDYLYDSEGDSHGSDYEDLGLLPGEVDALRNIMMELMDIMDDGGSASNQRDESQIVNDDEAPVVIIVVEGEDEDPADITLASLLYDEEEPWSRCTRSCTTRRYRQCLYEELCGSEPLTEEAFCYAPGSRCEKKVNDYLESEGYIIVDHNEDEVEDDESKDPDYFPEYTEEEEEDNDESVLYPDAADNTVGDYYDYGWADYLAGNTGDDSPVEEEAEEGGEEGRDAAVYEYSYDSEYPEGEDNEQGQEREEEEDFHYEGCGRRHVKTTDGYMRILGGREAHKGSWPWQVAILNRFKETVCGGTLIAPQWVLTAAHCLGSRLYARMGDLHLQDDDGTEVQMRVEKTFGHRDFNQETFDHDIALLKLPKEVTYNRYIIPACLPGHKTPPPMRSKCIITGWGKEKESHIFGSDVLMYARVPIVTKSACKDSYPNHPITMNHLCAGYRKGTADTCSGDSGGPLVCDDHGSWTIHGVTSFGEGCGDWGKFGVYTKVKNYLRWMKDIITDNS